jgi:cell division protein FtsX
VQFPYRDVDIWAPLVLDREADDRGEHSLVAIARLTGGASREQARAELRSLSMQHEAESDGHTPDTSSLRDWFVGTNSRSMLGFLLGAVGLLLLTACASVANLLLARGGGRAREMMVRTAIGATRGRLVRQLVTESLVLAVVAGFVGLLLAMWSIRSAAAVTHVPMSGDGNSGFSTIEGQESLSENPATRPGAARFVVTADYFRALAIPVADGRLFTRDDIAGRVPVVIVNEAMARRYWPGESPIGRRIKRGTPAAPFPWLTIVGVVPDVRQQGLGGVPGPTVYLPLPQSPEPSMTLVVKSQLRDAAAAVRIRSAIRSIDRDQPVGAARSLDDIVLGSVSARWLPLLWMAIFAGLALVLAALGVYGVVSYAVEQRRREFGIRLALGAGRSDLVRLAVRHGVVPALLGTVLGIGAAILVARVNARLFVGVGTFDVPAFLTAVVLISVCAFAASYVPARRIAEEDAALTLRAE